MNNPRIIHAPMNGRRYGVTAPITQYDYGYLLLPEGVELPTTYEIDFSNDEHKGTSLTVYGGSDGAEVPEELIRTGKDVFAFYYKVGEDYGKTDYTWRIPNHCRPSRDGETPTPSQQSSIDQLIVRSNEAVEQAEQSASDASTSAQNASADAERAEEARTDAQNYATQAEQARDDAQTYANNASASATASAQSASQSAQIKSDVEGMVDDAQASASASAQSATASANSASQAQGYAQSASASAQSASGYASNAQTSANTASNKASEASTSAQTASAKASEASGYATTASNKATEASGYATSASQAKTDAESARDSAQGYASDAQGYANDAQASAESISASASQIAQNTADISSLEEDRYKPYVVDSASGSIASFSDGADNLPLKSLIVNIDPVQDTSSGDPSPENICPISGWTGLNLRKCNANLWDDAWYALGNIMTLIDDETSDFYGYYCGSVKSWASAQVASGITKMFPNGVDELTVTAELGNISASANFTFRIWFYYADGTEGYSGNITVASRGKKTETKKSEAGKKCIGFGISTSAGTGNPNGCVKNIMVSVNGVTDFVEPVQNPLIPITFGQTVYCGKLDVLSGILTVYPYYASYNGESLTGEWISDRDVYAVGTTPTIGAQVVNIGAEGTEIQLEPHEVTSLLGQNNIFADTGDTTCEYRADTTLYINRLTEPDADMIADANITSGQYFMVGNTLYKATANIANGGQIIVGTNATRVSLAQALNEINS